MAKDPKEFEEEEGERMAGKKGRGWLEKMDGGPGGLYLNKLSAS